MAYMVRFTFQDGRTGTFSMPYPTREEAQRAIDERKDATGLAYSIEESVAPEERIKELEAKLARLETSVAIQEADLFTAREAVKVALAVSAEAHCKTVAYTVRLNRALELGDAMHLAHPSEEWAAYKEQLAASLQGHAKASETPATHPGFPNP